MIILMSIVKGFFKKPHCLKVKKFALLVSNIWLLAKNRYIFKGGSLSLMMPAHSMHQMNPE